MERRTFPGEAIVNVKAKLYDVMNSPFLSKKKMIPSTSQPLLGSAMNVIQIQRMKSH